MHVVTLGQAHELRVLRGHIDRDEAGQTLPGVHKPLDGVGVNQRCHAIGLALVIDLGIGIGSLVDGKLAHQVAHLADGTRAKTHGRITIDDRGTLFIEISEMSSAKLPSLTSSRLE